MASTVEGELSPAVTLDYTVLKGVRLTPNWREDVSTKRSMKLDVLQSGYTPSAGSRARLHPKTEHQKRLGIDPVFFDPQCIGKPMFWANGESGKANAAYRIAYNWSNKSGVKKWIPNELEGGPVLTSLKQSCL